MSQWFFTSDLHGQGALYEQLVALVAAHKPRVVLIGGDLCPHGAGADGVAHQRVFLQGVLVEFARRVRDCSPDSQLLLLMGNDDWAANLDCLEEHDGRFWQVIHERVVEADGIPIAGLSWIPITPFLLKDWERWEDGGPESPARLEGWTSRDGAVVPHRFDPANRTPTISGALEALAAQSPAETIFVLHSPPFDTKCDLTGARVHVGSRAIRQFIERRAPPLVLGGHIHESPRMSSSYRDTIGPTPVVNPGQFGTARLCGVWFDPRRVAETLRHTIYG